MFSRVISLVKQRQWRHCSVLASRSAKQGTGWAQLVLVKIQSLERVCQLPTLLTSGQHNKYHTGDKLSPSNSTTIWLCITPLNVLAKLDTLDSQDSKRSDVDTHRVWVDRGFPFNCQSASAWAEGHNHQQKHPTHLVPGSLRLCTVEHEGSYQPCLVRWTRSLQPSQGDRFGCNTTHSNLLPTAAARSLATLARCSACTDL